MSQHFDNYDYLHMCIFILGIFIVVYILIPMSAPSLAYVLAQAALTKYHPLGGLMRRLFSHSLEAVKYKIKVPLADLLLRKGCLPACR